jgi:protease IV
MGTVAASGGYWISTHGNRIFAEPSTLTGSIGVFGVIPNVKKLANEHGFTTDGIQMGKLGLPSITRPLTDEELKRLQSLVDEIYGQFIQKVSEGRGLKKESVEEIAQGRVWSGKEALKLGLVDELGGLEDAIHCAAKLAKIEKDYQADMPGAAQQPVEKLMKILSGGEKKKLSHVGLGEQLKAGLERQIQLLNTFNDPRGVYALMPADVSIR